MAKVKLVKDEVLGKLPQTWSLVRVGDGPGRGEGHGFSSVKEAEDFARQYGHEITERENSGEQGFLEVSGMDEADNCMPRMSNSGISRGAKKYGRAK